jgi:hypothetical protein
MFDRNQNAGTLGGLDWGELDFFEITSPDYLFSCNSHVREPWNYGQNWSNTTHKTDYEDPALTWFNNIDPAWSEQSDPYLLKQPYKRMYLSKSMGNDWHIYSCEWSPDQIYIYIDHNLFFKLDGDFTYQYTDVYGNNKTIRPVHELDLIMPIIFNVTSSGVKDDQCNLPACFDYDIDYFRYFKLKKDCNNDFIKANSAHPNFNFCDYGLNEHKVHRLAKFGETGCLTCSAIYNTDCLHGISVRANEIELEDGFEVTGEAGDFYACDVDCDAL